MAEKIYKIQKELEEKRLQRRETQQKIGGPGDPPTLGIRPPSSLGNDLLGGRSTLSKKIKSVVIHTHYKDLCINQILNDTKPIILKSENQTLIFDELHDINTGVHLNATG